MEHREVTLKSLGIMSLSMIVFSALVLGILRFCSPQMEGDIREASLKALSGVGMSWAEIEVAHREVSLSGTAPTLEISMKAEALLRERWANAIIQNHVVSLPPLKPYTLLARYDGLELAIEGYVATEAAAQQIQQSLAFVDKPLKISLKPRDGQPVEWADDIVELLRFLLILQQGELSISDGSISIEGSVPSLELAARFDDLKQRYDSRGYELTLKLTVPPPPLGCEERLRTVAENSQFLFMGMGAEVSPDSFEPLNEVAAIILGCEGEFVEILGHCDIAGSKAHNLLLSQQRADSVKDYLVDIGVDESLLISQGYGETRRKRSASSHSFEGGYSGIEFRVVTP